MSHSNPMSLASRAYAYTFQSKKFNQTHLKIFLQTQCDGAFPGEIGGVGWVKTKDDGLPY